MVQTKIGISGHESASSKLPATDALAGSDGVAGKPAKINVLRPWVLKGIKNSTNKTNKKFKKQPPRQKWFKRVIKYSLNA